MICSFFPTSLRGVLGFDSVSRAPSPPAASLTHTQQHTHLKDRISSMSLFIPNRAPELILLFTCLVQEGRLCPHWTKVAEMGKYGKMRNGLRFLELFMHMIKNNNRKVIKKLG